VTGYRPEQSRNPEILYGTDAVGRRLTLNVVQHLLGRDQQAPGARQVAIKEAGAAPASRPGANRVGFFRISAH
jgi:hypothetical protein